MLINPFHTTHGREVLREENETIWNFPFEHIFVGFTEIYEFMKSMEKASNVSEKILPDIISFVA